MIPKQCRVDAEQLPLFKPNMPDNGFGDVGEIEKWIDETVQINELTKIHKDAICKVYNVKEIDLPRIKHYLGKSIILALEN